MKNSNFLNRFYDKNRKIIHSSLIILSAVVLGFYSLPGETQKQYLPFLPDAITESKVNLGLDLQGGSQLDYKIDLNKVPEVDQKNIIDGIIEVIQKRVNGIGVAEPNIYASVVGDEKHIIVELAGIKDLEEAKATVGKTIQLEFKEQRSEADPNQEAETKAQAEQALERIKAGEDFQLVGQELSQSNAGRVLYSESEDFQFNLDFSSEKLAEKAFELEVGKYSEELIDANDSGEFYINEAGSLVQQTGFNLIKVLDKQEGERHIKEPRKVKFAQILIATEGVNAAGETFARSEEEAKKRIEEVSAKLQAGGEENTFEKLVEAYSDDTVSKANQGVVSTAVSENDGSQTKEVESVVLAFTEANQTSEIVKSPLGYHILKAVEITDAKDETVKENQVKVARIFFSTVPDMWQATELNGQYFQRADVVFSQNGLSPQVQITFTPEGGKLFEELTEKNIGKPIGIFVGGNLISAPSVSEKIPGGQAFISGQFTIKDAETLARDLNTGAIPAPIILVGQYNIGASLGQEALTNSLIAGAIGLALIFLFMVSYYRLAGVVSVIALSFYTALFIFLIKSNLDEWLALTLSIALFIFLIFKILDSKDSGAEKVLSLILACFILFFFSFLLSTPIVLTLAGIAGVILSIGMAVDANILIFERIKEELRDGRSTNAAIEIGFDRAWSSIKDSNFSSLITCAILFYFGSSMIQGFAFNLAAGILVSMFSAITITKVLLKAFIPANAGQKAIYFGAPKKVNPKLLPLIETRKIYYAISGVLITVSLVGLAIFGFKPGLDFTGGSLMELKFQNQEVSTDQVAQALKEIQVDLTNNNNSEDTSAETVETTSSTPAAEIMPAQEALDLESAIVITSEDGIIVKTKTISAEQHDQILAGLQEKLGDVEETRFQSVGPTVGESLRFKAIIAVIIASLVIVVYIAFAFRKIPKSIGKWNFGFSAIVSLIHDLILMLGLYVFLGVFLGVEVDALFITALLTTMGFSVHDTIVVLDRLREKIKTSGKEYTFEELNNQAVNETLARSINTAITTVVVLLTLTLLGAENIKAFSFALLFGIVIGTYSSIFIASGLLVDWYNFNNKRKTK